MDISSLSVRSFRSATTNPPINESRELTLINTGTLICETVYNGASSVKHYSLDPSQRDRIYALVQELQIVQLAFDMLSAPQLPVMPTMVGGVSGTVLTLVANGVSLSISSTNERIGRISAELNSLLAQCGEPYYQSSNTRQ